MKKIKILIVDDLAFIHKFLKAILESDPALIVVGGAKNGQEGIELTRELSPDVVVMDINMPIMDGLVATQHIMAKNPLPILILSSPSIISERQASFMALQMGALDVMEKPSGFLSHDLGEIGKKLIHKIKQISRIKVIRHIFPATSIFSYSSSNSDFHTKTTSRLTPTILGIGASTGGPGTIVEMLQKFPADFPIPIVIIQHIAQGFTLGFAQWLSQSLSIPAKIVKDGEILEGGNIYIAPNSKHLTVTSARKVKLTTEPSNALHIPSVDVCFQSLAQNFGSKAMGVLLTGMGDDGAKGLLEIFQKGGKTYVQDEKSSVVFGMPKVALDLKAAKKGMAPEKIGHQILQKFQKFNSKI